MKKQNTRREFIKRGAQIAGAGLLTTGLLGCNAFLDETTGGNLFIRIGHTTLYWTNSTVFTISKSTINGTGTQTILTRSGVSTVNGIAVCPSIGKIYWTESNGTIDRSLKRSNLNGSGIENLVTLANGGMTAISSGVAVDVPGGKVYWGESAGTGSQGVHRADLDGSNPSFQITGTQFVTDIALDTKAGKLYYISGITIYRANLDGTASGPILTTGGTSAPAIALDTENGKMYWVENGTGTGLLRRANLDISSQEALVNLTGGFSITGLTLDTQAGKVYWTQTTGPTSIIRRANMDSTGTGKETLVSGSGFRSLDLG